MWPLAFLDHAICHVISVAPAGVLSPEKASSCFGENEDHRNYTMSSYYSKQQTLAFGIPTHVGEVYCNSLSIGGNCIRWPDINTRQPEVDNTIIIHCCWPHNLTTIIIQSLNGPLSPFENAVNQRHFCLANIRLPSFDQQETRNPGSQETGPI